MPFILALDRRLRLSIATLVTGLFVCAGCTAVGAAQRDATNPPVMRDAGKDPRQPEYRGTESPAPRTAPPGPLEPERGNTPPGRDRTGAGPAEGAIRDPAGVVTDTPSKGTTK